VLPEALKNAIRDAANPKDLEEKLGKDELRRQREASCGAAHFGNCLDFII
jgi:hypothetical protein